MPSRIPIEVSRVRNPDTTALRQREFYRHWHRVDIRIADLDDQHHVNNSVFAVYAEEGRRSFWAPAQPLMQEQQLMVFIARLAIDFHREMSYPGTVDIGTAIARIGNSSCTMVQSLFGAAGCHATIEVVSVIASAQTRRPISIPDSLRAQLQDRLGG